MSQPHVVMVVGNRVTGDSRVEKVARSARDAGYRVTVVGIGHQTVPTLGEIDGIPVLRVTPDYLHLKRRRQKAVVSERIDDKQAPTEAERQAVNWGRQAESSRTRGQSLGWTGLKRATVTYASLRSTASRSTAVAKRPLRQLRPKLVQGTDRVWEAVAREGFWRRLAPLLVDYEDALIPVLIRLDPDLIHVHDLHPLSSAWAAARSLEQQGKDVKWVYDAHEWVPGLARTDSVAIRAWSACESQYICSASGVSTVSDQIADGLVLRHGLTTRPTVIRNTPSHARSPQPGRSTVREEMGLGDDVPVLVYSGALSWYRGLDVALGALTEVTEAHLAIVANPSSSLIPDLRDRCAYLGIESRVHFLPYVKPEAVTWYLSTATLGIVPLRSAISHDYGVPTKVFEYLHAGLPVVGSGSQAMREFLHGTRTGVTCEPGEPAQLAATIRDALKSLDALRREITTDVLDEYRWEVDEERLISLYSSLVGPADDSPHLLAGEKELPRTVVLGGGYRLSTVEPLASAIAQMEGVADGAVVTGAQQKDGPCGKGRSNQLADDLERFASICAQSSGALVVGMAPAFGQSVGDMPCEVRALAQNGVKVAVLLRGPELHFYSLLGRHQAASFVRSAPADERRRHRVAQNLKAVNQLPEYSDVFCESMAAAATSSAFSWLPVVVPPEAFQRLRPPSPRRKWTVAVAPPLRRRVERRALMAELRSLGTDFRLVHIDSLRGALDWMPDVDAVVDLTSPGFYGDIGAVAMAAKVPTFADLAPPVAEFLPDIPVIDASIDGLGQALQGLRDDEELYDSVSQRSWEFATYYHDGQYSAKRVLQSLQ